MSAETTMQEYDKAVARNHRVAVLTAAVEHLLWDAQPWKAKPPGEVLPRPECQVVAIPKAARAVAAYIYPNVRDEVGIVREVGQLAAVIEYAVRTSLDGYDKWTTDLFGNPNAGTVLVAEVGTAARAVGNYLESVGFDLRPAR